MSAQPKIKIRVFGLPAEDICELEEARGLLDFETRIVLADGRKVTSYDDLVRLAAEEKYRDRRRIEVVVLPALMGG